MTFLDDYFAGATDAAGIDDHITLWHDGQGGDLMLNEYLGMTWPEYRIWIEQGRLPVRAGRDVSMAWVQLQGGRTIWAHGARMCQPPCAVHWPTDHGMISWHQLYRNDRGIMERLCPDHGIGHPDPDDLALRTGQDSGVHGCCGCCFQAKAGARARRAGHPSAEQTGDTLRA